MYYTYVLIIPTILLFVCFLALPSLLHFSIKQLFFILVYIYIYIYMYVYINYDICTALNNLL